MRVPSWCLYRSQCWGCVNGVGLLNDAVGSGRWTSPLTQTVSGAWGQPSLRSLNRDTCPIRVRLHPERQCQRYDEASDGSLIETNGVATHFQVTLLLSMTAVLLAPSQNCCSVDADA